MCIRDRYLDVSTQIYKTYLKYVSPADIYPYSIDEVFIDVTGYLPYYHKMCIRDRSTIIRRFIFPWTASGVKWFPAILF